MKKRSTCNFMNNNCFFFNYHISNPIRPRALNIKKTWNGLRDVTNGITAMYCDMYQSHDPQGNSTSNRKLISGYRLRALALVSYSPHRYTEVLSFLVSVVTLTSIYFIVRWDCIKHVVITPLFGVHSDAYMYFHLGCSEFR